LKKHMAGELIREESFTTAGWNASSLLTSRRIVKSFCAKVIDSSG